MCQLRPDQPGSEVDVHQRIQFVEDDIDVVRADARRDHRYPFLPYFTGVRDKFAVLPPVLDRIEVLADLDYPVGIADGQYGSCQFFGTEVEVIDSSPVVDN